MLTSILKEEITSGNEELLKTQIQELKKKVKTIQKQLPEVFSNENSDSDSDVSD
jgi:hypothetical protein